MVNNPKGLHMRPAGLLAQLAGQFEAQVEVANGSVRVDGRSVLDLMTLSASAGSRLTVSARGPDAQRAVDALAQFIETDVTEEDEENESPVESDAE